MSKSYIVWVFLVLLPFVSAQEQISLQRSQVSIFLVVPAVIIGVLVLILVIATFKQRMTAGILRFMSFKRVFARPPHKHEAKGEPGKKVQGITREDYADYMEKLKVLEKQMSSAAATDVAFKEFSYIVKDFFSNLVGGDHAFTDEEIAGQLESKRKILLEFSEKVSELKYGGGPITKGGVVDLINEFKGIVSTQIKRQASGHLPVSKNLVARIFEEDKKIFLSVKQYIDFLRKEDKRSQIQEMLVDEQKILRQNIKKAKSVYSDILKLYCRLSPDERKKIYPRLLRFYNNINSMVFSSLYSEKSKKELAYFSKELERIRDAPKPQSLLKKFTSIPGSFPKVSAELPGAKYARPEISEKVPGFGAVKKVPGFIEVKFRIPKLSFFKLFGKKPHEVRLEKGRRLAAKKKPVFRVPKVGVPSLDFSSLKFWQKRDLKLPELKLPMPSKIKRPLEIVAPVPEKGPSFLEKVRSKISKVMEQKPHRVPMRLELKDEGKVHPVVQEPKKVPRVEIPRSLGLGVSEREKVVEKEPPVIRKPIISIRIPSEVLPRIRQVVKVISRADAKDYEKVSETNLRELERIKSFVKEKPKLKPSPFQDEERQILDKIDRMIESTKFMEYVSLFDKLHGLLEKAESELARKEYAKAEVTYESIKPVYLGLSEREKKIVYHRLFDFYKRLMAALAAYSAVGPVKAKQDAALLKEEEILLSKLEALKNAIS